MKQLQQQIFVTRPYLPPIEDFKAGLEEVWRNRWLTNNGPMLQRFQSLLADYLGVGNENVSLLSNGTLALEIGFQAMGLSGAEVITTPFTFVATAHAIKRIGAVPVFADIDPATMCLSPAAAEKLITPRTKAIVPVHVYAHPCDVEGFARLGEKYGLKIIYDAAHAFGVKLNGKSIAAYGDMSMFSFHPTKLFHSCEGGLLVFKDPAIQRTVDRIKNFAILSETECVEVGTNAKMNELQALTGLSCLKVIDNLVEKSRAIHAVYRNAFAGCDDVAFPNPAELFDGLEPNNAYCPILFKDFDTRERVYAKLKEYNVFSRRYFYPLLTDFAPYADAKNTCPVAEDISRRILTLPTYYSLDLEDVKAVAENVMEICKG